MMSNIFEHLNLPVNRAYYRQQQTFIEFNDLNFIQLDVHEASISDLHKMMFSVIRKTFVKGKPKTVFYHCYNVFDPNFSTKHSKTKFYKQIYLLKNVSRYFSQRLIHLLLTSEKRSDGKKS